MKVNPFYIAVVFALYSHALVGQNQRYQFTRMNVLESASIGKVNFIAEDKNGFIWFSEETNNALTRFDGYNVKRYRHDPNNENSLGGTHPECLLVDKLGNIWIGFFGNGLDRFNPPTETFTHFDHDPNVKNGISNDYISSLAEGPDGKIYIATFSGLDILDPVTGLFENYNHEPNDETTISSNTIRKLYFDSEGTLWLGTGWFVSLSDLGGLNKFNSIEKNFTRYLADPADPTALTQVNVTSMLEDSKGNFWVGTMSDGLHLMDRKTGKFEHFPYDPLRPERISVPAFQEGTFGVTFIAEDQSGNLWIGGEGIDVYNLETGYYQHFGDNQDYDGSFIENSSWSIHMGKNGLIWISTQPGLYMVDPLNFTIPIKEEPIPVIYIESDSISWKASTEGLVKENSISKERTVWRHDPNDEYSLCSERINVIYQDNRGDTWVGTDNGLTRIMQGTNQTISYYHDPSISSSLGSNGITAIVEDHNENLWIGTNDAINKLNSSRDHIDRFYRKDIDSSSTTIPLNVAFLAIGEPDVLWIGHNIGGNAYRWNTRTNDFKGYNFGNSQSDIHVDTSGGIWIASQSGLHKYDPETDRFNTLVNYAVNAIVADNENNLWANSISSILEIREDGDIIEYEMEALRRAGNISTKSNGFLKTDGTIMLGDNIKYYYFNPEKMIKSQDTSKLYFTNMAVMEGAKGTGKPIELSMDSLNKIDLRYNENSFSLSFTEIDYREKTKNRIQYKLNNYDPNWRTAFSEQEVSYSNVPTGDYIFQIKAVNSSTGLWAQNELHLHISPPWWKTWWAYSFYGLIFIGALVAVDRFQRRRLFRIEKEKAQLKELEYAKEIEKAYDNLKSTQAQLIQSEKMASLGELTAGIAHEIQNPLNFVNNFSDVSTELIEEAVEELEKNEIEEVKEILSDLKSNLEKISHHGGRASGIVKGMLEHSRTSKGEKVPTDINALCDEYLRLAYHGLRAKDNTFNAAFETDFDDSLPKINVIPQDIGRVLLNILNNAFYTVNAKSKANAQPLTSEGNLAQKTKYIPLVTVSTRQLGSPPFGGQGEGIAITINDNGIGMSKETIDKVFQPFFTTKPTGQGTGLGMSISYDIVKAHGGTLEVESKEGVGTQFIIQLPRNS